MEGKSSLDLEWKEISQADSLDFRLKDIEKMRMLDMHAHLSCLEEENRKRLTDGELYALGQKELKLRREHGVATFFSCGTPGEWEMLDRILATQEKSEIRMEQPAFKCTQNIGSNDQYLVCEEGLSCGKYAGILRSFGIHPWYSDGYRPDGYLELFRQCDALGEIGMDSVWCDIPLVVQQRCFERQLELAAELKKPVILHTKGQEAQIAKMILDFPGKICVHWYSGDIESFQAFLELDCYFTLGPDLYLRCGHEEKNAVAGSRGGRTDLNVQSLSDLASAELYEYMLQEIPADRLFIETDGISAVAWAKGAKQADLSEIPVILGQNLDFIAGRKGMKSQVMSALMRRNLQMFVEGR